MPKVSIIVPVYNVENYLDKCLKSLVNQTLNDIEIIIVNDSTPDNSQQIINKYVQQYPHKIKSYIKPNGGIADTRNFGLSKATGNYIGFVDGDDHVDVTMFEKLYNEAKRIDAQIVSCDFYWEYPNKIVCSNDGPYQNNRDYMVNVLAVLWNKIYKREWIQSLDFSFIENLRYEDVSYLIKGAPDLISIGYVNEPLVYYVQRKNSIMSTQNERVSDMQKIFLDIFDYYEKKNMFYRYYSELEYLTTRFFLGSTFVQVCQISSKRIRYEILNENWELLNSRFPNWKKNKYLKEKKDIKHLLYRNHNKVSYFILSRVYHLYKKFK